MDEEEDTNPEQPVDDQPSDESPPITSDEPQDVSPSPEPDPIADVENVTEQLQVSGQPEQPPTEVGDTAPPLDESPPDAITANPPDLSDPPRIESELADINLDAEVKDVSQPFDAEAFGEQEQSLANFDNDPFAEQPRTPEAFGEDVNRFQDAGGADAGGGIPDLPGDDAGGSGPVQFAEAVVEHASQSDEMLKELARRMDGMTRLLELERL